MNEAQAHKDAKQMSITEGQGFVVWVPDHGPRAYSRAQVQMWISLIFVTATYVNGELLTVARAA